ncbi:MAG TPA: alanine--tRNA ligase, partial [Polyangiaceae bacterium]|nr:alanine--tRNA ligase [Polyangiaceae bacterium]
NAGMVQFKDVFTGRDRRPYRRATSSQKCIRISGKHNDLENVGPSPRHHTFFEMLGNFSFGDYFKEQAIVFAWEFLTRDLDLPKDRMVFTYFRGEAGVPADEAARDLWKRVTGFGDDRVIGLGMSDNFWQMGDTGPCGPSSEIHWYHGPDVDPSAFGTEQTPDGRGWMEIWNLVFMQFERDASGQLDALPAPSIDTGAGLERLAGVVQGKLSNYDTDLLRGLVDRAARIADKPYGGSMQPDDVSLRVIADHARTTAFLIAEGVLPDRTGREYVLRRVMRRAIRHGHLLGIRRPFLHDVALGVAELMGDQYPELRERADLIASVSEQEEIRFRQTLERGLGLLEEKLAPFVDSDNLPQKSGEFHSRGHSSDPDGGELPPLGESAPGTAHVLSGADAFQLYDTYGFPLDLTEVICAERGYTVDTAGYELALDEARHRSEFKGVEEGVETVYREVLDTVPGGAVKFTGYESVEERSRIVALIHNGARVDSVAVGDEVEVVVGRTPFYGEAGGQMGDHGVVRTETGTLDVEDAQKPVVGLVVHRGHVTSGTLAVGEEATLAVDVVRRDATRRNHSATHLLHLALRKVLGAHVQQKGSLVGPDRLRLDFTHGKALSPDEIRRVENFVNERILGNSKVETQVMSIDKARESGAMMIFEEKYGDVVRMLSIADSLELCGGTHARATGDIGLFKIVGEQGVAAGVRRILATTGENSLSYLRDLEERLERAARAAKSSGGELAEKIEKLVLHERALEKQVEELQRKLLSGGGAGGVDELVSRARDVHGIRVLGVRTEVSDRGALRELAEKLRDKLGDAVVLVASEADGKAQLVLTVSKSLTDRFKAGDLIRGVATLVGGSGGGRPDMAQAGGTDVTKLNEAIESLYAAVQAAG